MENGLKPSQGKNLSSLRNPSNSFATCNSELANLFAIQ